jgi:DNA-binding transcriptional regulator/RsmH inhibitor MraZ
MSFDSDECDGLLYLRQERRYIEICEEHVIADALEYKTARMIAPFFSRLARPDESGRCIIPKEDMDFLGFHGGDKAVFFGLGASFGICAQNNWPEIEKAIRRNLHSPTFDIGKPLLGIV